MPHPGQARIVVAALLLGSGCSEELNPVSAPTAVVRGQITADGRPIVGGWVEFIPVDGAVGHHRTAPIDQDGRYEASGVAVGENLVAISHSSADRIQVGPRMSLGGIFGGFNSPLRRRIEASPASTVDLELRAALQEIPKNWKPGG